MKHLVLAVTLMSVGLIQINQLAQATNTASVESPQVSQFCCGGPTCLPGEPCGLVKTVVK